MDTAVEQAIEIRLEKIDRVIGVPPDSGSRQLVYILLQVSRIGQLAGEIFQIQSIFRGEYDELILITPPLDDAVNHEVFRIFTRGIRWIPCPDPEVLNIGWEDIGVVHRENRTYVLFNPSTLYRPQFEKIAAGVPPQFISLTEADEARGRELRQAFNIPQDAAVVTLHVREPGYLPQATYHSYRDANVATYVPAIKYLIEQGYYVVRIGDTTMQRLSSSTPQFIDAPFHPAYNQFVEPYFIWTSRFFIGTFSGPYDVARAFNKPSLLVNGHIHGMQICGDQDVFVYKKFFSHTLGRLLTYREVVLSALVDFTMTEQFVEHKVQLIDNTPEEILRSTAEMVQRLDGTYAPTPSILAQNREDDGLAHMLRARTKGPFPFFGPAFSEARLSEEYLRCNPGLLGHRVDAVF